MSDNEWLASLKAGDKVIVTNGREDTVSKVIRRTPSGRIHIERLYGDGEWEFNPNGRERGSTDSYFSNYLTQPTPERVARIQARSLSRRLDRVNWSAFPLDTLRQVAALVDAAMDDMEARKPA